MNFYPDPRVGILQWTLETVWAPFTPGSGFTITVTSPPQVRSTKTLRQQQPSNY